MAKAKMRTAQLVMPPRALGRLHEIGERLCAMQGTLTPRLADGKAVLVMAGGSRHRRGRHQRSSPGGNRRHDRGPSWPAAQGSMRSPARSGAEVWVADMGIIPDLDAASLEERRAGCSSARSAAAPRNFARGPAMTLERGLQGRC
ncbi:MAG: nicotinate-nucleotide--dimethylbenzimidazole phosphoribosyltransferase [Desulfobacterales bacterium]|nr:nicotinate-nucleotide--dimethylbenzimidazole phosphoribosyltransferase [Desulfobacterales bacterium]